MPLLLSLFQFHVSVSELPKLPKLHRVRVLAVLGAIGLTLTLLHSERPKLHTILAFLSAIGLTTHEANISITLICGS